VEDVDLFLIIFTGFWWVWMGFDQASPMASLAGCGGVGKKKLM
jgi:hypothetical protein